MFNIREQFSEVMIIQYCMILKLLSLHFYQLLKKTFNKINPFGYIFREKDFLN